MNDFLDGFVRDAKEIPRLFLDTKERWQVDRNFPVRTYQTRSLRSCDFDDTRGRNDFDSFRNQSIDNRQNRLAGDLHL